MKSRIALLIAALGLSAAAIAQQDTAPVPEGETPKFADIDANEDGKIDPKEAEVLAAVFEKAEKEFKFEVADANEDGAIDAAEYAALMS